MSNTTRPLGWDGVGHVLPLLPLPNTLYAHSSPPFRRVLFSGGLAPRQVVEENYEGVLWTKIYLRTPFTTDHQ